jgi:hypothetical protein
MAWRSKPQVFETDDKLAGILVYLYELDTPQAASNGLKLRDCSIITAHSALEDIYG